MTSTKDYKSVSSFGADTIPVYQIDVDCALKEGFSGLLPRGLSVVHEDTIPAYIYAREINHSMLTRPIAVLATSHDTSLFVLPIDTSLVEGDCQSLVDFLTSCERKKRLIDLWLSDSKDPGHRESTVWIDPYEFN